MRNVDLIDARTRVVHAHVTWTGQAVIVESNERRKQAWARGLMYRGSPVTPKDGEVFLDAILSAYARSGYMLAVECEDCTAPLGSPHPSNTPKASGNTPGLAPR